MQCAGLLMDYEKNYDEIYDTIKRGWDSIAKPLESLGRLETLVAKLGAAQNKEHPAVGKSALFVLCADNGIVEEGVSQSAQAVTRVCAENIAAGKTTVGIMAAQTDTEIIAVDMGIACSESILGVLCRKIRPGTRNFAKEPAMTKEEVEQAVQTGVSLVEECQKRGVDVICIGEMGIGNTTTSAAVAASLLKYPAKTVVGRGAGLSEAGLARKKEVVQNAIDSYGLYDASAFDVLRSVGGYDIAGMVGVYEGARRYGVPVILDGAISLVAALVAERMNPGVMRYLLPSHKSREPLSALVCDALGIEPVLDANMALGEGTGALLMLGVLKTAVAVYEKSLRFSESGVAQYKRHGV